MSLRINQNVLSVSTYANLKNASVRLESSITKLSSGLRINSAADDAAGLAISEKMRRQIRGLDRAVLNAQDGVSMIQTAEGALTETQSIIQRMRELALQSANDTLTSNDRLEIQGEIDDLRDQINAISNSTEFNTKKLLNGNQSALVTTSTHAAKAVVTGNAAASGDFQVSLSTVSGGISQVQRTQIFTNKRTGELASGSTRLQDISEFYDADGVFALTSTQTLTINGNANTSEVILDGQMTLNELAAELQQAIGSASGLGIFNTSASVITETATGVTGDGGYIQIDSGVVGENGVFSIAASQSVVDSLGFAVTRKAVNNMISANIKDEYGNSRNVTTSNDTAVGLLSGVNIQFDSSPAQIAGNGGLSDGLKLGVGSPVAAETFNVEFLDSTVSPSANRTISLSLAAGDWSLQGISRSINAQLANPASMTPTVAGSPADYGFEASIQDGQLRLTFSPTDPKQDSGFAIDSVVGNTLGLLEGDYNGFISGEKNKANVLTGFTTYREDAYADREMMFNINGTDASTAAFTLQNDPTQPDLKEINDWLSKMNSDLKPSGVRVDQVNGSLAFTSLQLGKNNVDGSRASVTMSVKSSYDAGTTWLTDGAAGGTTATSPNGINIRAAIDDLGIAGLTPANLDSLRDVVLTSDGSESDVETKLLTETAFTSLSITDRARVLAAATGAYISGIKTGKESMQDFGITKSVAYGSGDTNFRVHVVDTKPQFQIGADAGEHMKIAIGDMSAQALGIDRIDLTSVEGAEEALEKLNQALDTVSAQRSKLGAYQNRLEYSINNLQNSSTNLTAAESRIRDLDIAHEMTEYTRNQIVSQAGMSMLAQANSMPQMALQLLQQ
jgi:flagellin